MSEIKKWLNIVLCVLQVFIGIGAIPAAVVLISDPSGAGLGMSMDMLVGSPFPNFLIPGIFLLMVNGVGSLIGAFLSFRRHEYASLAAMGLGLFLIMWIIIQVISLGPPVHWLQWMYFVLGGVELVLGWQIDPRAISRLTGWSSR
ncbi:MAG: hypothetical protein JXJ17_16435 [Anaerolineae bacterium]|nr:hypothetical protein [Anaerolineae bacterium]